MFHDDREAALLVADPARLSAVRATRLTGSPFEEVFDRLTRLAAKLTQAPVGFFSIVEADHDYFKSIHSDDPQLASLRRVEGRSFCHFSMLGDGPLVVSDARTDPRMAQLPAVVNLGVVSCLGVPIKLKSGYPIGAFCVVDVKPRDWTQQDIEVVTELGLATLREVQLRGMLRDADQADATRSELLTFIASDLRNPVTVISLSTDLLSETGLSEAQVELMGRIKRAAERMERSIRQALDVTKEA
jgi:GAF domain-containing protein